MDWNKGQSEIKAPLLRIFRAQPAKQRNPDLNVSQHEPESKLLKRGYIRDYVGVYYKGVRGALGLKTMAHICKGITEAPELQSRFTLQSQVTLHAKLKLNVLYFFC